MAPLHIQHRDRQYLHFPASTHHPPRCRTLSRSPEQGRSVQLFLIFSAQPVRGQNTLLRPEIPFDYVHIFIPRPPISTIQPYRGWLLNISQKAGNRPIATANQGSSINLIVVVPEVSSCDNQAQDCVDQIQLNHGPEPQASHRRCLLHDSQVVVVVADVNEIAPRNRAHDTKDGLSQWLLVFPRKSWQQGRVRLMRVQRPKQNKKDY